MQNLFLVSAVFIQPEMQSLTARAASYPCNSAASQFSNFIVIESFASFIQNSHFLRGFPSGSRRNGRNFCPFTKTQPRYNSFNSQKRFLAAPLPLAQNLSPLLSPHLNRRTICTRTLFPSPFSTTAENCPLRSSHLPRRY